MIGTNGTHHTPKILSVPFIQHHNDKPMYITPGKPQPKRALDDGYKIYTNTPQKKKQAINEWKHEQSIKENIDTNIMLPSLSHHSLIGSSKQKKLIRLHPRRETLGADGWNERFPMNPIDQNILLPKLSDHFMSESLGSSMVKNFFNPHKDKKNTRLAQRVVKGHNSFYKGRINDDMSIKQCHIVED